MIIDKFILTEHYAPMPMDMTTQGGTPTSSATFFAMVSATFGVLVVLVTSVVSSVVVSPSVVCRTSSVTEGNIYLLRTFMSLIMLSIKCYIYIVIYITA